MCGIAVPDFNVLPDSDKLKEHKRMLWRTYQRIRLNMEKIELGGEPESTVRETVLMIGASLNSMASYYNRMRRPGELTTFDKCDFSDSREFHENTFNILATDIHGLNIIELYNQITHYPESPIHPHTGPALATIVIDFDCMLLKWFKHPLTQ